MKSVRRTKKNRGRRRRKGCKQREELPNFQSFSHTEKKRQEQNEVIPNCTSPTQLHCQLPSRSPPSITGNRANCQSASPAQTGPPFTQATCTGLHHRSPAVTAPLISKFARNLHSQSRHQQELNPITKRKRKNHHPATARPKPLSAHKPN